MFGCISVSVTVFNDMLTGQTSHWTGTLLLRVRIQFWLRFCVLEVVGSCGYRLLKVPVKVRFGFLAAEARVSSFKGLLAGLCSICSISSFVLEFHVQRGFVFSSSCSAVESIPFCRCQAPLHSASACTTSDIAISSPGIPQWTSGGWWLWFAGCVKKSLEPSA